jgi:hypothetical protein
MALASLAGAAMRWLIAAFSLALLAAATADVGVEIWDGRIGQSDPALRAIHYDADYVLTARRRRPAE